MYDDHDDNPMFTIGLVLFVLGFFMFLYGFIGKKAARWYVKFLGWFSALFVELAAFAALYAAAAAPAALPVFIGILVLCLIAYGSLLVWAHKQDELAMGQAEDALRSFFDR